MARRSPRGLRPDERELWSRVARTARPLSPVPPEPPPPAADPALPESRRTVLPVDLSTLSIGIAPGRAQPAKPPKGTHPPSPPLRMDAKAFGRMKRGKLRVEGRVDLHGMTLDQAHGVLVAFLGRSHAEGRRLVLVITGKGRESDEGGPIPQRRGAIKRQVPHWMAIPPLRGMVQQVTEAHRSHGGAGAYYVYLTRRR